MATTNRTKAKQLRTLLETSSLRIRTPEDMGIINWIGPEEVGDSHEENACLKAESWSQLAQTLVIASDGGIVIPALGSEWKSLLTHRFAGEHATDNDRTLQLLHLMEPYVANERYAYWVEALAIAENGRTLISWEINGPSGVLLEHLPPMSQYTNRGFWVFDMWYFPVFGKTYNELNDNELSKINDHWVQLRSKVNTFFSNCYSIPHDEMDR